MSTPKTTNKTTKTGNKKSNVEQILEQQPDAFGNQSFSTLSTTPKSFETTLGANSMNTQTQTQTEETIIAEISLTSTDLELNVKITTDKKGNLKVDLIPVRALMPITDARPLFFSSIEDVMAGLSLLEKVHTNVYRTMTKQEADFLGITLTPDQLCDIHLKRGFSMLTRDANVGAYYELVHKGTGLSGSRYEWKSMNWDGGGFDFTTHPGNKYGRAQELHTMYRWLLRGNSLRLWVPTKIGERESKSYAYLTQVLEGLALSPDEARQRYADIVKGKVLQGHIAHVTKKEVGREAERAASFAEKIETGEISADEVPAKPAVTILVSGQAMELEPAKGYTFRVWTSATIKQTRTLKAGEHNAYVLQYLQSASVQGARIELVETN